MSDFVASNGITAFVREGGTVQFQHGTREESCGILQIVPGSEWWEALREFFQAEADERLGRWRSAKNPVWTAVVQDGSGVVLFRHDDGQREFSVESRETQLHRWSPELREVAREYFDAHPEPKPWHDAKPGEAWVATINGEDVVLLVDPDQFTDGNQGWNFDDPEIESARRIFPAVAS